MPKTFKQVFFRPGRYHLGGGIYRDFSADDVAAHVKGAQAVLKAGHGIPILYEHAAPGSAEGSPVQLSAAGTKSRRDQRAEQVKHGAGWVKRIWLTSKGEAAHELEVTDPDAAKGIKNGSVKFTSPEFRARWADGKGREFANLISHVALTHQPRNLDQSAIEEIVTGAAPAMQFSLDDWQQFSADDEMDEEGDEKPKEEVSDGGPNGDTEGAGEKDDAEESPEPDMPEEPAKENPHLKAILEHLKLAPHGIHLPDDTSEETFFRDLLTALKTAAALKAQREEEEAQDAEDDELEAATTPDANDEEHDDEGEGVVEEKPPIQFSLADVDEGRVENKLLKAVIRSRAADLDREIKEIYDAGKISPALAKALSGRAGSVQFSEDGDEFGKLKLSEVVSLLGKTLPKAFVGHLNIEQYSTMVAEERPADELLSAENGEMTPEQVKAFVDRQADYIPGLKKSG